MNQNCQRDKCFEELCAECQSVKDGAHLSDSIRNKLEQFEMEERREIVSRIKEGCAPLFLACEKGNVEIVEYLISRCGADIEQVGMLKTVTDIWTNFVTPLWCAAKAGKFNVVVCLVNHNADVNSVCFRGSPPLEAACMENQLDIVKYLAENGADILQRNYDGRTCLSYSTRNVQLCEVLLKHGADVNAQDRELKTALHFAIQNQSLKTTKLLLQNGAQPAIKCCNGDDALQTACLAGDTGIFDYLIEIYFYSPQRVVEAYELIGSTCVDYHDDLETALYYWRKALFLRESSIYLQKPKDVRRKLAYSNATEFDTFAQLENIAFDIDAMQMQSLLVCERILGPFHQEMYFRLSNRGRAYAVRSQHQRCIDLWRYTLELNVQKHNLLHPHVSSRAQELVMQLFYLQDKYDAGVSHEKLQYEDVIEIVKLLISQFENSMRLLKIGPIMKRRQDDFDDIIRVITHLLYLLNLIPKSEWQEKETRRITAEILKMEARTSKGETLLHLVVSKENTIHPNATLTIGEEPFFGIFPNAPITLLLLECGADVDATDCSLNTPLHIASLPSNYRSNVINILLQFGAHIDRRNSNGNQPHRALADIEECSVKPLQYQTLQCLSAQKIAEYNISFHGVVPATLEHFIKMH